MIEFVAKHMYEKTRNYVFFGITHPEVFLNIPNSHFSELTSGTKIGTFSETTKFLTKYFKWYFYTNRQERIDKRRFVNNSKPRTGHRVGC